MKNVIKITLFLLLSVFNLKAQTNVTIVSESFETDGETSRYVSNACSTSTTQYFLRYSGLPTTPAGFGSVPAWIGNGADGSSCWIAENPLGITSCPATSTARTLELNSQNINGYNNLKVKLLLADGRANHTANPNQWESNDEILIEYSLDGGAWTKIGAFYGDAVTASQLRQDVNLNGSSMDMDGGIRIPADFTDFTFSIPATGSSLKVRINLNYTGATEEFAFDNFRIIGDFVGVAPSITGHPSNQTICSGANTTFTVSASNATSYQWQVNTGSGFVNVTNGGGYSGVTTATLTISAATGAMNGYQYRCIASGAIAPSATSNSAVLTVNSAPNTPGSISGAATICSGTTNSYSVATVSGATSYNWTLPSGWTGTSTTTSISTLANSTSGNITVTASNSCGASSASTKSVTVNSTPATPGAISGATTVCAGSFQVYSVVPVAGATAYNWTVPAGWTVTQSANTITALTNTNSGNITVNASNSCGSSSVSTLSVTVGSAPSAPSAITGQLTVCLGTSNTYSISSVPNATSYTWSVPANFSITSGQGTTVIQTLANSMGNGNITVTANNSCGASSSTTFSVSVNSAPASPGVIFGNDNVCENTNYGIYSVNSSMGAASYSWSTTGGASIYSGNGTTMTFVNFASTSATLVVNAVNACGSTPSQVLNITVNQVPSNYLGGDVTICYGDTAILSPTITNYSYYEWISDTTLSCTQCMSTNAFPSDSTNYVLYATNNGCDSYDTIRVNVLPRVQITQNLVVCNGQSITVGGSIYNTSGIYTDILTATNGCDSTVTTNLTVNPPITGSQTLNLCAGQSVTVGSNTYTTSGVYTDLLTAANGCDSTVTTNLTVNPAITGSQTLTLCAGQSVTVGSNTYTTSGVYTDVLTAANGCDSTVTTNLTVENTIDNTTSLNGLIISANQAGATYQWVNCDNGNQAILGETNQSFTATSNGNYAVIVTVNSCFETSACINVNSVGLAEKNLNTDVQLIPNPTKDIVLIRLSEVKCEKIVLINSIGQVIYNINLSTGQNEVTINLTSFDCGFYYVKLETQLGVLMKKVIKE